MAQAIDEYEIYLKAKGNKQSSINTTTGRLRKWQFQGKSVSTVTQADVKKAYLKRVEETKTDTHRNELAEVKTFFRWCIEEQYIEVSPAESVKGVGRRSRGKPQLRRTEAKAFSDVAFKWYEERKRGWEAALGCLLGLWLGLRTKEICTLQVRDYDPGPETWLWVAQVVAKSQASKRRLIVPEELLPLMKKQVAHANGSRWLFPSSAASGHREKTWLRRAAERICNKAKIPYTPPHGLRGTQSTLAMEAGATGDLVAKQLGHSNVKVTQDHYLESGAVDRDKVRRGAAQLKEKSDEEGPEKENP